MISDDPFWWPYKEAEFLQNDKGFDSSDDFYIIAESICCFRQSSFRKKFLDILKALPKEDIIPRCQKVIRIHDRMYISK